MHAPAPIEADAELVYLSRARQARFVDHIKVLLPHHRPVRHRADVAAMCWTRHRLLPTCVPRATSAQAHALPILHPRRFRGSQLKN